jgi:phage-related minor tail protein
MIVLNDALNRNLISFQEYELLAGKAFETFSKATEAPKDGLEEIRKLLDKTGEAFTETFVQMMMTGKASFKSLVDSIIADLLRLYIRQKITVPLFDALKTVDLGSIFTGKAVGGPVRGGNPYLVGEKGPELFVPGASGSIVRNQDLGNGGGSEIVINQTLQITTGVQSTVRAEIATLMPQIAAITKSAVADARARGGSFSAAMR